MCLTKVCIQILRGLVISKKFLLLLIVIVIFSITAVNSFMSANQDFDGLFTMNVPSGQHYSDVSYCKPNGELGSAKEYWEDNNLNCELDEDEMVVYYYDNSLLVEGESNAWQHAIDDLTGSYLYKSYQNDGNLVILTNTIGMRNVPEYIVGQANDDGSKVVFVGGYNLDDLKNFANSIEFY